MNNLQKHQNFSAKMMMVINYATTAPRVLIACIYNAHTAISVVVVALPYTLTHTRTVRVIVNVLLGRLQILLDLRWAAINIVRLCLWIFIACVVAWLSSHKQKKVWNNLRKSVGRFIAIDTTQIGFMWRLIPDYEIN